jgi:hypothetical protein
MNPLFHGYIASNPRAIIIKSLSAAQAESIYLVLDTHDQRKCSARFQSEFPPGLDMSRFTVKPFYGVIGTVQIDNGILSKLLSIDIFIGLVTEATYFIL